MNNPASVLLVEGNDDLHVIASLLKNHNFPEAFKIVPKDGIDNLLKTLPVQLKASGIARIGVVVDADLDLDARWAAIRTVLAGGGYDDLPSQPDPSGTVISQLDKPRFGVWIMPDNRIPGMLDDFAACLIPKENALSLRAKQAVDRIPAEDRVFSPAHTTKAYLHTWLAWQKDPGTPIGLAITKRFLDAAAPETATFLAWLRHLFID
jgi:hypothetical protein